MSLSYHKSIFMVVSLPAHVSTTRTLPPRSLLISCNKAFMLPLRLLSLTTYPRRLWTRPSTRASVDGEDHRLDRRRNLAPPKPSTIKRTGKSHGVSPPPPVAPWSLGAWAVEDRLSERSASCRPNSDFAGPCGLQ